MRIDPATDKLLPTLEFPGTGFATGVDVVPGSVWVSFGTGGVIVVDPATDRTLATIELPEADLIAAGKSAIWVGDILASTITRRFGGSTRPSRRAIRRSSPTWARRSPDSPSTRASKRSGW